MNYTNVPYQVEYAPSKRSSCCACLMRIKKHELRIAAFEPSEHYDGPKYDWYHWKCFFPKFRPKTTAEFRHFDNIRWKDQLFIRDQMENPTSLVEQPFSDFEIGYTHGSENKCSGCIKQITKHDRISVSKKDYVSNAAVQRAVQKHWYHLKCFFHLRKQLQFLESGDKLPGFENLVENDQNTIKTLFLDMVPDDGPLTKRRKRETYISDTREERERQNDIFWSFRDKLSDLKRTELRMLLEENNQTLFENSSRSTLNIVLESISITIARLDLLADAMAFGALNPCQTIQDQTICNGQLLYQSGLGYRCIGARAWGQCNQITKSPGRSAFRVPRALRNKYPFLAEYKSEVRERMIEVTVMQDKPKPLKDMEFFILGDTLRTKAELKTEILLLGGELGTEIHENLTACISNLSLSQAEPRDEQMQKLEKLGIQVVLEGFIDEVKRENRALALITEKNICDWGEEPFPRIKKASNISKFREEHNEFVNSRPGEVMYVKGGGVDPRSGLEDKAYVHQSKDGCKYSVTLGGINVQLNLNNFYKLQVLEDIKTNTEKPLYWLFRSWGRIGENIGDMKLVDDLDLEGCLDCFKEYYRDKSGNEWTSDSFLKFPNKRYPIGIDHGDDMVEKLMESTMKSQLEESVQDLNKLILDPDIMREVILEFKIDLTIMPLGKLADHQILKGYEVLRDLQMLIQNSETNLSKFVDATNKFYTFIPHALQKRFPESLLDTREKVESKMEMLKSLLNLTFNYRLLNAKSKDSTNPLDYHYKQMNVDIVRVERESEEFKLIQKYVMKSHGKTHDSFKLEVEQVFTVKRHGEAERFERHKELGNRKLLWHGTRIINYPSILTNGLKIVPLGSGTTGAMFGQGIYFADRVSKSERYCHTTIKNPTALLLLCEVALGVMDECYQEDYIETLPEGLHSRVGCGKSKPDPTQDYITDDGICVPLGEDVSADLSQESALVYNEYIVFNEEQIQIKYLVKTKKIFLT